MADRQRRRILYVEQNEDGTTGGSHKILADLVTRLSRRIEPVVLFFQDNPWAGRLREAGVEVHSWDDVRSEERVPDEAPRLDKLFGLLRGVRNRRRFLKKHRIDAVHLNNAPFVGADSWIPAARTVGVPCMTYVMGFGPAEKTRFQRLLQRRFDLYFPLSRILDEYTAGLDVEPERRIMAYPGIDLEAARKREARPPPDVREELGVPPDQVVAMMVGNIRPWKGQSVVLEGVAGLSPELRRRLTLFFVGDEGTTPADIAYGDALRLAIVEEELEDCIRLLGYRNDVPDLLEAADIAVHASVHAEPFGLVVLEGLLHGCAVVAADAGGPVEMLTPETGLLFDASDPSALTAALERLLERPEERRSLATAARARAEDFDVREHVDRIEEGYRRLGI